MKRKERIDFTRLWIRILVVLIANIFIANIYCYKAYADTITASLSHTNNSAGEYEEVYDVGIVATSDGLAGGASRTYTTSFSLNLENANEIRIWPSAVGNSCCNACTTYCTGKVAYTVNGVTTLQGVYNSTYGYYGCILSNRNDWKDATVTISLTVISARPCDNCGKAGKYRMAVSNVYVYKKSPVVTKQPVITKAQIGDTVVLNMDGKYQKGYKWQVYKDGRYVDIVDGSNAYGSVYSGASTNTLTISNVGALDNEVKYRGGLLATGSMVTYTDAFALDIDVPSTPTPTTTPTPTQAPTATPTMSPTPTNAPQISPVPTTIPGNGGISPTSFPTQTPPGGEAGQTNVTPTLPPKPDTQVAPVTSSSAYIPSTNPGDTVPPSGESAQKSEGTITSSGEPTKVTVLSDIPDPEGKMEGLSMDENNTGKQEAGKKDTASVKHRANGNSEGTNDSREEDKSIRGINGSSQRTTMKNGVLYILDDEDEGIDSISLKPDSSSAVEEYELENAYTKNDLLSDDDNELRNMYKKMPVWGYILIVLGFLIGLLLLLFILFFGAIVEGECEENDEVYELCGIRFVYRKEGQWCINLGEVFEENAIVRLRLGILFAIIFKDVELKGLVTGVYEGEVKGNIEQKMLLMRKRIRRMI